MYNQVTTFAIGIVFSLSSYRCHKSRHALVVTYRLVHFSCDVACRASRAKGYQALYLLIVCVGRVVVCGCDIFKKFTILTLSGKINNNDIHPLFTLNIGLKNCTKFNAEYLLKILGT